MSNLNEHMAEQDAITARFEALTDIGDLAYEVGAGIETCEDVAAALAFCSAAQEQMSPEQLRRLDGARADSEEDCRGIAHQLDEAMSMLSELRDGSAMSTDMKRQYDRLANGEYEDEQPQYSEDDEMVSRCAPRWAWEVIDETLALDQRSSSFDADLRASIEQATTAMAVACEDPDRDYLSRDDLNT